MPEPAAPATVPLSASEHEAFQEIGRTLAEHNGRVEQPIDLPPTEPEDDLGRNAAALVETTTAGMMVTRGRLLLFANQALLDQLQFPTHADFDLAVGSVLAQQAQDVLDADAGTIALPRHDGDIQRFEVGKRPVRWNGEPARLWMLQPSPAEAVGPNPVIRALLDAAGDAVALIEGSGALMMLNRQGEQWFGRDRSRLAGESFTLLLAPESRTAAAAMLSEVKAAPDGYAEARGEVTARPPGRPEPLARHAARAGRRGPLFGRLARPVDAQALRARLRQGQVRGRTGQRPPARTPRQGQPRDRARRSTPSSASPK